MYVFSGTVIPERAQLTTGAITWKGSIEAVEIETGIRIDLNQITATVRTKGKLDIQTLKNHVFDLACEITNLAGFEKAFSYTVQIDKVVETKTQKVTVFGIEGYHFSDENSIRDGLNFRPTLKDSLKLPLEVITNPYFSRAASELRNAIKYPSFTAMHCQFAIEAIRTSFGENEKVAWKSLRKHLLVKEKTLRSFEKAAREQKHGKNISQSWEERRDAMQIAWEVAHRFQLFLTDKEKLNELSEF